MRHILLCLALITGPIYAEQNECGAHQCIAVVDAGSTGSRLHVFSYDLDKTQTPINVQEIWSKKITPGFATIGQNNALLNTYMEELFIGAPTSLPVYFYATAGMRLLPQAKQQSYYQNLAQWFSKHNYWTLKEAKTITGNEEALLDWVSVNYYLGKLKDLTQSVGVMDIGGASVQIAFLLENADDANPESQRQLKLYGKTFTLFIHSFLGLGQNEMSHQLFNNSSCFAKNYPLPDGQEGQGNAFACAQDIAPLINEVHKANLTVQPALSLNAPQTWYALGGVAYLAESKLFSFKNNQITAEDLLDRANLLACQQPWESLKNQFPNNEFIDTYCLFPSFYYALMVDGYEFSPEQTIHYIPSEKNIDWTLGVVFHHSK